jgi:hypothetical protein
LSLPDLTSSSDEFFAVVETGFDVLVFLENSLALGAVLGVVFQLRRLSQSVVQRPKTLLRSSMLLHPLNKFPQRWKKCPGLSAGFSEGGTKMSSSSEVDLFDLSGVAASSLEFASVEVEGVKALGVECSGEDGSGGIEALEAGRDASESIGDSTSFTLDASLVSWQGTVKSQLSFGASYAS